MKLSITVGSICALILVGCASHEERESVGAGGPITTSSQSGTGQSYLGDRDQTFLKETAHSGLMEVQMGRLGAQKGQNQAVRQLGQKMVQDHSKANQELKLLASQKSVTLPSDLKVEHQSMLSHLKNLEGAEFDQAFKKHAVESHEKGIQRFETASQQSADADVKAFAQKTLPTLQQHLKMAKDIPGEEQTGSQTGTQTETTPSQPATQTDQ